MTRDESWPVTGPEGDGRSVRPREVGGEEGVLHDTQNGYPLDGSMTSILKMRSRASLESDDGDSANDRQSSKSQ